MNVKNLCVGTLKVLYSENFYGSTVQVVVQVINELGPFSLDLILSRDKAGNSPFVMSLLQKRNIISKYFWGFILREAGLDIFGIIQYRVLERLLVPCCGLGC